MEPTHITVRCPECGYTKDVSVAFEGQKIYCPNCATPFVVGIIESEPEPSLTEEARVGASETPAQPSMPPPPPPPPAPPPEPPAPVIKLKKDQPPERPAVSTPASAGAASLSLRRGTQKESEGPVCRGCQMVLEPGAKVCSHCGLNQATGRYIAAERATRARLRRLLGLLALLAVLGGGGWWLWSQGWILKAQEAVKKATDNVQKAISGDEPASRPPQAPNYTPEQKAELERTLSAQVRAETDRSRPLYEAGQIVSVDQVNGLHSEGIFRGYGENGTVLIETSDAGTDTIPIDQLRPLYRIRFDRLYRQQWIEQEIRRQIAAALAPKPAAPETH